MNILVINSGSSSIKFSLFARGPKGDDPTPTLDGQIAGIGSPAAKLQVGDAADSVDASTPEAAIHLILDRISRPGTPSIDAIGYRVVHPGPHIDRHLRITEDVLRQLEAAIPFAPLHDPEAIGIIREAMVRFPGIPHYACFDTVFHQTMPGAATTYPIPLCYRDAGVRRYGFHGLSCESIVHQMHAAGITPARMIVAHLGSGCSVTTIIDGRSVDTSMGLTPTGGVVMGTRPGDLDPGLLFYLLRQPGATIDTIEHLLNHDAGMKALVGYNDMKELREASADDPDAALAIAIFTQSLRRTIGGMAAVHGPIDTLVFTGGVGEHDAKTRAAAAGNLFFNQPVLDLDANQAKPHGLMKISTSASAGAVYVVPADEDLMIALHVARLYAS